MIRRVSSAYCIIGKFCPLLAERGSFNIFISLALIIMLWSRSVASTKRSGERGSRCLTPRLQWKVFPDTPLSRMEDVPDCRIL